MDQWGCQGITILWEILVMLFSRELLRDLVNLNGVPLLQGSLVTMGNNDIFEGALARFGKISMEFLHWGGLHGNYCEIWENLNGFLSFGGFTRESYSCLKGASDEYSHGPMRPTVQIINWVKSIHGEQWTYGSLQSRFGKIWRKVVYSYCPRGTMIKFA